MQQFLELRQRWLLVIVAARMAPVLEGDGDQPVGAYLAEHREEMTALLELARLEEFDKTALNDTLNAPALVHDEEAQ